MKKLLAHLRSRNKRLLLLAPAAIVGVATVGTNCGFCRETKVVLKKSKLEETVQNKSNDKDKQSDTPQLGKDNNDDNNGEENNEGETDKNSSNLEKTLTQNKKESTEDKDDEQNDDPEADQDERNFGPEKLENSQEHITETLTKRRVSSKKSIFDDISKKKILGLGAVPQTPGEDEQSVAVLRTPEKDEQQIGNVPLKYLNRSGLEFVPDREVN